MEKTKGILGSGWNDAVRDMVIVVASILIAFALDAWWDERVERGEERVALAAVALELDSIRAALDEALEHHREMLADTERLLANLGPDAEPWPGWGDDLMALFDAWTFDPPTGSIDALLASGRIQLVQDEELRAAIAALPRRFVDAAEEEQVVIRHLENDLIPFVRPHVAFRALLSADDAGGPSGQDSGEPIALLRALEFENLAMERALSLRIVVNQHERLARQLAELAARLAASDAER